MTSNVNVTWTPVNSYPMSIACGHCDEISGHVMTDLDPRRIHDLTNIPNTWGFHHKINDFSLADYSETQKLSGCDHSTEHLVAKWYINDEDRKEIKETLKIATAVFDGLGYIPGISIISGLVRVIAAIYARCVASHSIEQGLIVGRFKDEVEWTCDGHIIRGILEMLPGLGQLINLACDLSYCDYHRYSYIKYQKAQTF